MAEDLSGHYSEVGVKCRYMHSEIETLERVRLLRDLRRGEYDVLIGINLLREDSICRRFRWSRFSMQTRKGSCAPRLTHPDYRTRCSPPERPGHTVRYVMTD